MRRTLLRLMSIWIVLSLAAPLAWAGDSLPPKPGPKDKCPVCGMFVAKYPDFIAVIGFKDGSHAWFDGGKDLMKYYFNLKKYDPSKSKEDIKSIHITEYYSLELVDVMKSVFVTNSDVYGPMGREIIPFVTKEAAEQFVKDHGGKLILTFGEIDEKLVKSLD